MKLPREAARSFNSLNFAFEIGSGSPLPLNYCLICWRFMPVSCSGLSPNVSVVDGLSPNKQTTAYMAALGCHGIDCLLCFLLVNIIGVSLLRVRDLWTRVALYKVSIAPVSRNLFCNQFDMVHFLYVAPTRLNSQKPGARPKTAMYTFGGKGLAVPPFIVEPFIAPRTSPVHSPDGRSYSC